MQDNASSPEDLAQLSPYGRYLYHCARGELAYQRSASGKAMFYPRINDPETGGPADWQISAGKGAIYAVTLAQYKGEPPLPVAVVELDEGFRLMTNIITADPQALGVGTRVEVRFRSLAEGQPALPVFIPQGEAQ